MDKPSSTEGPNSGGKKKRDVKDQKETRLHVKGTYIGGDINIKKGDFVGRDKYQITNQSEGVSVDLFIELLKQMKNELRVVEINEEDKKEIENDLDRALAETLTSSPRLAIIRSRLAALVEFFANSTTIITAAPQLQEMAQQALGYTSQLFR